MWKGCGLLTGVPTAARCLLTKLSCRIRKAAKGTEKQKTPHWVAALGLTLWLAHYVALLGLWRELAATLADLSGLLAITAMNTTQVCHNMLIATSSWPWHKYNALTLGFGIAVTGHIVSHAAHAIRTRWQQQRRRVIILCRFAGAQRKKQCRNYLRRQSPKRRVLYCIRCGTPRHADSEHVKTHEPDVDDAFMDCLRGGAKDSPDTKGSRREQALLEGLQKLLATIESDEEPDAHAGPAKPQKAPEPNTLLDALQQLVAQAESDPANLLHKLKTPCKHAVEGRFANQQMRERQKPQKRWANAEQETQHKTWAQVTALHRPREEPPAARKQVWNVDRSVQLWTPPGQPNLVGSVTAAQKALEEGSTPPFKLISASQNKAEELRTLAQAHGMQSALRLGVVLLHETGDKNTPCHWVHVSRKGHGPEIRKLPIIPIGTEMPDLPPCKVNKVTIPKQNEGETCVLRATLPAFCFNDETWKHCQNKPANFAAGMLKDQGLQHCLICSYGWRSLESPTSWAHSQPESITGFLKVTAPQAADVLKVSGTKGIFFEQLAKNRGTSPIEWIAQDPKEADGEYYARVITDTHQFGYAYRRPKAEVGWENGCLKGPFCPWRTDHASGK